MIIWFVLLFILVIYQIDFSSFQSGYLGREQSAAVKGIFAAVILLSHVRGYITLSNSFGDILYNQILNIIGQTMVTVFFFYSGFGVLESYKEKADYDQKFFRRRILRTLIHFDMAVGLYMVLNWIVGSKFSLKHALLSLIGWTSVGNSNWFICVILMLYMLTLISFFLNRRKKDFRSAALTTLFLCILLWITMHMTGRRETWYNTMLCYPAGMLFSAYKYEIDTFMSQNRNYCIVMAGFGGTVFLCWLFRGGPVVYSIFTLTVCMLIVTVTMKAKINNRYLQMLGKHSFSIFILQRLPMIVLKRAGVSEPIIFTCLSFVFACILAYAFDLLLKKVDSNVLKI